MASWRCLRLAATICASMIALWLSGSRAEGCLRLAIHDRPAAPAGYMDQFQRNTRALPPAAPRLAASDWDPSAILTEPPSGFPGSSMTEQFHTGRYLMGIKVYRGLVYVSWPHEDDSYDRHPWLTSREVFLEQLIACVWLYKDFPDVDLLLNYRDKAMPANTSEPTMPIIAFSAINTTFPTGRPCPINPQHTIQSHALPLRWCAGHTRGFTIPHHDAWRELALSPGQLQFYSYCVHQRFGMGSRPSPELYLDEAGEPVIVSKAGEVAEGRHMLRAMSVAKHHRLHAEAGQSNDELIHSNIEPFLLMAQQANWTDAHKPVVFWRGGMNGHMSGWAEQVTSPYYCHQEGTPAVHPTFMHANMLNKRIAAVTIAQNHPWLDVRLTKHYSTGLAGFKAAKHAQLDEQIKDLLVDKYLPVEEQSQFTLVLSMDGFGPPFRLPRQLLGMAPVARVETIQREWLAEDLIPGVHYEPLAFDLSDLVSRTEAIVKEAAQDSRRLQRMAIAARDLMVDKLHVLAQLDAVMWSIMRVKDALNYTVRPPTGVEPWSWGREEGWQLLQMPRNETWGWHAPALRMRVGPMIEADLPELFQKKVMPR